MSATDAMTDQALDELRRAVVHLIDAALGYGSIEDFDEADTQALYSLFLGAETFPFAIETSRTAAHDRELVLSRIAGYCRAPGE